MCTQRSNAKRRRFKIPSDRDSFFFLIQKLLSIILIRIALSTIDLNVNLNLKFYSFIKNRRAGNLVSLKNIKNSIHIYILLLQIKT